MTAKFGGASLPSAVELANDEELWIENAKFKDASHMKDVHSHEAKNPDLEKLHSRFDLLISGKEVYHAEFESLRPQLSLLIRRKCPKNGCCFSVVLAVWVTLL